MYARRATGACRFASPTTTSPSPVRWPARRPPSASARPVAPRPEPGPTGGAARPGSLRDARARVCEHACVCCGEAPVGWRRSRRPRRLGQKLPHGPKRPRDPQRRPLPTSPHHPTITWAQLVPAPDGPAAPQAAAARGRGCGRHTGPCRTGTGTGRHRPVLDPCWILADWVEGSSKGCRPGASWPGASWPGASWPAHLLALGRGPRAGQKEAGDQRREG